MNSLKLILYGVAVVCGIIGTGAMLSNNPVGLVIAVPVAAICIVAGQKVD